MALISAEFSRYVINALNCFVIDATRKKIFAWNLWFYPLLAPNKCAIKRNFFSQKESFSNSTAFITDGSHWHRTNKIPILWLKCLHSNALSKQFKNLFNSLQLLTFSLSFFLVVSVQKMAYFWHCSFFFSRVIFI